MMDVTRRPADLSRRPMLEIVMPKSSCWGANKWGTLVERRTPGRRTFAEAGDDAARDDDVLHDCKRCRGAARRPLRRCGTWVFVEATACTVDGDRLLSTNSNSLHRAGRDGEPLRTPRRERVWRGKLRDWQPSLRPVEAWADGGGLYLAKGRFPLESV